MELSEAAPLIIDNDSEASCKVEPSSTSLLECLKKDETPEDSLAPDTPSTLLDKMDHSKNGESSQNDDDETPGPSGSPDINQLQIIKALQTYALINAAQQSAGVANTENTLGHNALPGGMLALQNILNLALYRQMLTNAMASQSPYMSIIASLLTSNRVQADIPDNSPESDSEPPENGNGAATSVLASLLRASQESNSGKATSSQNIGENTIRKGGKNAKSRARSKGNSKNDSIMEEFNGSYVDRSEGKVGRGKSHSAARNSRKRKSASQEISSEDDIDMSLLIPAVYVEEEPDYTNSLKKFRKIGADIVPEIELTPIKSEMEMKGEISEMVETESVGSDSSVVDTGVYSDSIIKNSFYAGTKPRRKYKKRTPKDGEYEKEKKYTCPVCGKMFKLEASVSKHMWLHTGEQPYSCTICEKKFTEKSNLTTHMRIHTGEKPHGCSICGRRFTQQASLMYHIRSHTGEKPYQCKTCKKRFVSSSGLNSHMISHSTYRPFKCDICDNSFARKSGLDLHMMVHTGEKPYECNDCGKLFTQRGALTNHEKQHTGDRKFHCDVCGKTFVDNCTLKKHMRIHSGEMPYQCELCGKRFLHRTSHYEHMKVHNDERTYPCPVCGKLFRNKSGVNTHMVTHTKEKPHECNECGKRFALKSNLKHHIKIHVGNRDFICEICDQAFLFKDTLREHVKTHTGEKTYVCQVCGKGYMWKPSFVRHMDEVHEMNPDDHWEVFENSKAKRPKKFGSPSSEKASLLLNPEEQSDCEDEEEEENEVTAFDFEESNDILGCKDTEENSNDDGDSGQLAADDDAEDSAEDSEGLVTAVVIE